MSLILDQVEDAVVQGLVGELAKLPAKAVELIVDLVKGANASEDPQRYVERRLIADGAHLAAQSALDGALAAVGEVTK